LERTINDEMLRLDCIDKLTRSKISCGEDIAKILLASLVVIVRARPELKYIVEATMKRTEERVAVMESEKKELSTRYGYLFKNDTIGQ
jgi:hypothetical protein